MWRTWTLARRHENFLARLRVASLTLLGFRNQENAKLRQAHLITALQRRRQSFENCVDDFFATLLGLADTLGHVCNEFCFVHEVEPLSRWEK